MTGHPEAVLARELRHVLRRDRAGHRHGRRRRRAARASARRRSSRCSRQNIERLTDPARRHHRRRCPTPTAAPARPGPTASTSPTRSREGPAHRLRRLHRRGGLRARSRHAGHEVVRVDLMLPHGARRRRRRLPGPTSLDVRDAATVGRPAATASTWSATRPRWSAPGSGSATCPSYASPQRPRHRRAAGRDARGRRAPAGARLVDGGVRRGPLRLPRARRPGAAAADRRRPSTPATSRTTARVCARPARLGAGRRGRPARPAQRLRRQQGRAGALRLRVGAAGRSGARSR